MSRKRVQLGVVTRYFWLRCYTLQSFMLFSIQMDDSHVLYAIGVVARFCQCNPLNVSVSVYSVQHTNSTCLPATVQLQE